MTVSEYNQCVDLYADGLYRFILKNLKDVEKSKDVVQDTFEKVWNKSDQISFEKAKSYFFSTAYHVMIDYTRKEKNILNVDVTEEFEPQTFNSYSDVQEILEKALDKLPEIQKNVILLRDYEGYAYDEIGDILQLTESQVKVYIYRARKYLQEYIRSIETLV